ncbi:DeoR/GlpR family DNA-binding transcription regulator [Microlunatus elymi]|nr:DeoR/GlpR family DNA-binding transcription regulator [Microlunatus elymi]
MVSTPTIPRGGAMYPPQRQQAITELLLAEGRRVSVGAIADRLRVGAETVRRDLDLLERRGLLRRVRGGAELVESLPFERALAARHADQAAEKRAIADAVIKELPAEGVVVLDSGSLTYVVAERMPTDLPLVVVTNNLPAAALLAGRPKVTVMTLPGMIRGLTQASVDGWTTRRLETVSADLAIVGVNGLTPGLGLTTTNPEEAAVKRAMLLCARRRLVPVVSARIGRNSFCSFASVNEADKIITDPAAAPETVADLRVAGPEVHVVDQDDIT